MNFQEYVNQKDPQKQAPLSVKVTRQDIKQTGNFAEFKGMNLETVTLLGFNYILINDKGTLYTIDENGQPKEQSVFYLINNL